MYPFLQKRIFIPAKIPVLASEEGIPVDNGNRIGHMDIPVISAWHCCIDINI